MVQYMMLLGAAGVLTWWMLDGIRRLALCAQLVDRPNSRSSHTVPTPRLGGVALFLVITPTAWWLLVDPAVRLTLVSGVLLAGLSLLDDLRGLSAALRLTVHVGVAYAVTALLGPLLHIELAGRLLELPVSLSWALPVIWITGFINAFNFMDGSDGIAGTQALVAVAGWILLLPGSSPLALLAAVAAASLCGFLLQNWSPARIFMGDVGSAYLGLLLACFPFLSFAPERLLLPGILLVWPFVFDTAFTLCARARRGANILQAHREHLYQRLLRAGHSHANVAVIYGAWAALSAAAALTVANTLRPVVVLGACVSCVLTAAVMVAAVRRVERTRAATLAERLDAQ